MFPTFDYFFVDWARDVGEIVKHIFNIRVFFPPGTASLSVGTVVCLLAVMSVVFWFVKEMFL